MVRFFVFLLLLGFSRASFAGKRPSSQCFQSLRYVKLNGFGLPSNRNYKKARQAYFNSQQTDKKTKNRDLVWGKFYQQTIDRLYAGRNRLLLELKVPGTHFTIDQFIQNGAYLEKSKKFLHSHQSGLTNITGRNSKSALRSMYGKDHYREMVWPIDQNGKIKLDQFRLAVTYSKDGVPINIEIFARDTNGLWVPFLYERIADDWRPVHKVKKRRLKNFCFSCHGKKGGGLTPRPHMLKSFDDFKEVGYVDDFLIAEQMKYYVAAENPHVRP